MLHLHHFQSRRRDGIERVLKFWGGRLKDPQSERNLAEVLGRADLLIDGLEMLLPAGKLSREAVVHVQKAAMLAHGALQVEGKQ